MIDHEVLKKLLRDKKEIFLNVEKITEEMCSIDADELESYTLKRGELLDEIALIDEKTNDVCSSDIDLRSAINHSCDRGGLSEELAYFYDTALKIKAIAYRIYKNDNIVLNRIENERDNMLEKIEILNLSGHSVAEKYHQSVQSGINSRLDFDNDIKI